MKYDVNENHMLQGNEDNGWGREDEVEEETIECEKCGELVERDFNDYLCFDCAWDCVDED